MAIFIDLAIIIIIMLSTYLGYKKGLIGVAFKILSFLIALIVTLFLYKPVSDVIIQHTTVDESIQSFIIDKFGTNQETSGQEEKQEQTNLPDVMVNYMNTVVKDAVDNSRETIVQAVAKDLAINIIHLIVMIGLFVIIRLLLLFAKAILELVSEIPLIKQCNEVGGIIYGIVRAIVVIYVILAIASFLLPAFNQMQTIQMIQSSFLGSILYNNNLILMLLF